MPSWRRSISVHMKNKNSILSENYEEFTSLTLRTRNSKKPLSVLARKWKHRLLLLYPAKLWRRIVGVVHPIKLKTRLACILEADESLRLRTGESLSNHHEDHLEGKGDNSLQHENLVHKLIFMPQVMKKNPVAKATVDKEREELEKIPTGDLTNFRSKLEVIDVTRTKDARVHVASLMDICHLKNAELETKLPKYKGRVVLRDDIVKDDFGSYALFTEQRSSASQMTAAKVMDIISRLPGCARQAADAVCACIPKQKWRILPNYW